MFRFFVDKNQISDKTVYITGPDYNHIKNVLRMTKGEEISVMIPGDDTEYRCEIDSYGEEEVECTLLSVKKSNAELNGRITLYQALPKADKMELVIQKAVELGVHRIVPVASARAVVKLDGSRQDKKITRWNAISEAAAKQSKRSVIPQVTNVMTFKEAIEDAKSCNIRLIPYEMADHDDFAFTKAVINGIAPGDDICIFVGPEGGFTEDEIELALSQDFKAISLGHRILRTETAGMVVLSWIMLQLEGKG